LKLYWHLFVQNQKRQLRQRQLLKINFSFV
jgi:hypothetical protein